MEKLTNQKIIERVKAWQNHPKVHPLTCGNDSTHTILEPKEVEGKVILVCPTCDYIQQWIPEIILTRDPPQNC